LDPTSISASFSLLPFSMLWLASFIGMGLAKTDFWLPTLALPTLVAVRPLSIGDLVFTKFKVAAAITVLGLFLLVPMSIPAMQAVRLYHDLNPAVFGFWNNFRADHPLVTAWIAHPIVLLLVPGLVWLGIVEAMCPGITGNQWKSGWLMARSVAIFTILVGAANWFYRHPGDLSAFLPFLPAISVCWLLGKWGASAQTFLKARQSGIFSRQQFAILVTIWLALTFAIALAAWLSIAPGQVSPSIVLFIAVWLFPGPHIPRCGLNLALNRHR
jgi:hypothetical protein